MEIRKPFAKFLKDIRKNLGKSQKNSKKTQNSRKKLNVSEDCPSLDLPSGVKKAWHKKLLPPFQEENTSHRNPASMKPRVLS